MCFKLFTIFIEKVLNHCFTIFTSLVIVDHIILYYFLQHDFEKSLGMTSNCIWATEKAFEVKKQK